MISFAHSVTAGQPWRGGADTAAAARSGKQPIGALLLTLGITLAGALLTLSLIFYTPAYTLSLGETELGPVAAREMAQTALQQAEGQIGEILGRSYTIPLALSFRPTLAAKEALLSYTELTLALYDHCPAIKPAYVLSVDGVEIGAAVSSAALHGALDDLQAQYHTADTQALVFANETRISRQYIPAESAYAMRSDLLTAARAPKGEPVQIPQLMSSATRGGGASAGGLLAQSAVYQTSELTVASGAGGEAAMPLLSVFTLDRIRTVEEIAPPVREVPDPERYEGESALLLEGSPGLLLALTDVTKLNGEALHAESVSEFVLLPASETLMAVGTKERPSYLGSGQFQWPCQGQLTSPSATAISSVPLPSTAALTLPTAAARPSWPPTTESSASRATRAPTAT